MPSALSRQLKQLTTPAATAAYEDRRKRPSLLFHTDKAAEIDRESALAIGVNGLEALIDIDSAFDSYHETLFSDVAASVNRSTLTQKQNAKLSRVIKRFLYHLLPYLQLQAALQCIEWLVYRFDIHKHEASTLLRVALFYHDNNTFARILHLVDLDDGTDIAKEFHWLTKTKVHAITLPRETLFNRCRLHPSFLNSFFAMLDEAINLLDANFVDSRLGLLYTFIAQLSIGAVAEAARMDKCVSLVEHLMPLTAAMLDAEPLNGVRASLMIIVAICQYVQLTENVTRALMVKLRQVARDGRAPSECLSALAVVCMQESVQKLSSADPLVQKMKRLARTHLNGENDELALAAQLLLERLPQPKTKSQEYSVE